MVLTVSKLKEILSTMNDEDLVFLEGADHTLINPSDRKVPVYFNGTEWLEWPWESLDQTTTKEAQGIVLW